ncbi:MAG: DUF885 domain-containing protein [Lachnospiraceae bacterium]|nr:DUF885 domain-containing protein [Lachnospiraceae bacterium]
MNHLGGNNMIKKNFKRITALALVIAMTFSMAGCEKSKNSPSAKKEQEKFDTYLQESFEESVTTDTVTLHYTLAHPENFGITMEEVTLGEFDVSEETMAEEIDEINAELKELEAFDYDLLTEDQQLTYNIVKDVLHTNLLSYDNPYLYEPFAYTSGLQSNLPITMSEYTFYDEDDVKDYIALLNLIPDYYQKCLDFEKTKSDKGFFMSDTSADEVIRQCEEYIADPENNLLIATFNDRIGDVPGMTPEKIEDYKKQNHDAVINSVVPAYQNVIDTFTSLKGTGTNDLGLAHFEGGKDYYKYLLKQKVGTDKTPEEVIETLDAQIEATMGELYGLAMVNYDAYMGYIEDYENFYQGLDTVETIRYFEDVFVEKFPEIPEINFTVTPVHESLEGIVSPAFYMTPPMDDYENNSIYINEGSESGNALWSTLAHEGIPGHMYQFVYFLSNDPEPIRTLLSFNGYQEGWATYVEIMSFDYYTEYADESYAGIEAINTKLNLLVCARIEIGVNYQGWTLEETSNYLTSNGLDGSGAQEIMDYVIAEPGNYQMYVMGWLEFEELREYAQEELGDKFNEVEFHKVLLDAGPCQFYILEDIVKEYVKENK